MPRYGQRSDPQMHVTGRLMMASVGSTIVGSARSSKRMSRAPYNTVACISHLSFVARAGALLLGLAGSQCHNPEPPLTLRPVRRSLGEGGTCGMTSSFSVLLVGDVFEPVDGLAIELLLDGDVRHRRGWRRAVPMLFARG